MPQGSFAGEQVALQQHTGPPIRLGAVDIGLAAGLALAAAGIVGGVGWLRRRWRNKRQTALRNARLVTVSVFQNRQSGSDVPQALVTVTNGGDKEIKSVVVTVTTQDGREVGHQTWPALLAGSSGQLWIGDSVWRALFDRVGRFSGAWTLTFRAGGRWEARSDESLRRLGRVVAICGG
jgi:hypothetical protein